MMHTIFDFGTLSVTPCRMRILPYPEWNIFETQQHSTFPQICIIVSVVPLNLVGVPVAITSPRLRTTMSSQAHDDFHDVLDQYDRDAPVLVELGNQFDQLFYIGPD